MDFRTKFVDIYRMFSDSEEGINHVYETIQRDMQSNPIARSYLAQRHLFSKIKQSSENDTSRYIGTNEPAFIPAIKACVEDFNQAVQVLQMRSLFFGVVMVIGDIMKKKITGSLLIHIFNIFVFIRKYPLQKCLNSIQNFYLDNITLHLKRIS